MRRRACGLVMPYYRDNIHTASGKTVKRIGRKVLGLVPGDGGRPTRVFVSNNQ